MPNCCFTRLLCNVSLFVASCHILLLWYIFLDGVGVPGGYALWVIFESYIYLFIVRGRFMKSVILVGMLDSSLLSNCPSQ